MISFESFDRIMYGHVTLGNKHGLPKTARRYLLGCGSASIVNALGLSKQGFEATRAKERDEITHLSARRSPQIYCVGQEWQ